VTIWYNLNFSGEVGWYSDTIDDRIAHPYSTTVNSGVASTIERDDLNILPLGQLHWFKVHDANGDRAWSFAYDGNPLGNRHVSMNQGTPVDQSERCNTSDSLSANFDDLQELACELCGWQPYGEVLQWTDRAADYRFCWVSDTHFRVKPVC
jgi:hypothetical protein